MGAELGALVRARRLIRCSQGLSRAAARRCASTTCSSSLCTSSENALDRRSTRPQSSPWATRLVPLNRSSPKWFSTSSILCEGTIGSGRSMPDLSIHEPASIRNFAIIAHIDHGKSTLADRMLEMTGTIYTPFETVEEDHRSIGNKNEQVLDTLKVERERGITVRAQSATMFYKSEKDGKEYMLNLLDTPGHADFSSELLRSLLPCQGVLLLVDAAQGIQAQTLSVLEEAQKRGLKVIGAVNKWDLVEGDDRGPAAVEELAELISCEEKDILKVSAKTGMGVRSVLEALVARIPPPSAASIGDKLQTLVFDNWYDSYRGVVSLMAVSQGELRKGDNITSTTSKKTFTVLDIGIMSPKEISISSHPIEKSRVLRKGMAGYVSCNMKNVQDSFLGDTFHHDHSIMPPLESFKPLKSMVFAGIYPQEPGGFVKLEEAIRRLTLTDRSVTSNRESSSFLGQGFRLGFNGSLHMDVFRQRLEDEYGEEIIVTRPLVPIRVIWADGKEQIIDNPANFPEASEMKKTKAILEPMIKATIVAPDEFTGAIINHCTSHRGVSLAHSYLSTGQKNARITLTYLLPLSSIVTDFHSQLKSLTSGFASFDYEEASYEPSELVRMNVLVNSVLVDALCAVVHKDDIKKEGRQWCERLKDAIPRQQYEVIIQAVMGSTVVARERVAPVRKDVTAGLYGGDYTRKQKQLAKQKEGKKRLKERSIGRVTIPTSAFFAVLGGKDAKKKKD